MGHCGPPPRRDRGLLLGTPYHSLTYTRCLPPWNGDEWLQGQAPLWDSAVTQAVLSPGPMAHVRAASTPLPLKGLCFK